MVDKKEAVPDVTLGDLLATFDSHLLYLLERRYLDHWHRNFNHFCSEDARPHPENCFFGFRMDGFRCYGEGTADLAPQNMENFLGAFRDGSHTLLCVMDGKALRPPEVSFVVCPRSGDEAPSGTTNYAGQARSCFTSNFPGSQLSDFGESQYIAVVKKCGGMEHVGMLTGVPGRKKHDEQFFAQGMERFLDATHGLEFVCLMVARPYTVGEVAKFIDPVLRLKNELGQLERFTLSDTDSTTDTKGNTFTLGTSIFGGKSITETVGHAATKLGGGATMVASSIPGAAVGAKIGAVVGGVVGTMFPIVGNVVGAGAGALVGTVAGALAGPVMALATGSPLTTTDTTTLSNAISGMGGVFGSYSRNYSTSVTRGRTVGREAVNYAARYSLGVLDEYMERLRGARSYGMWDTGFYFFAADPATYTAVKNAAMASFSGERSGFEPLRVLDLEFGDVYEKGQSDEKAASAKDRKKQAVDNILAGFNPPNEWIKEVMGGNHPLGKAYRKLSTPLTTSELAIMVAPPQRECRSLSVTNRGAFAGKRPVPKNDDEPALDLGTPLYYGEPQADAVVSVPVNSLTRHAFVTGITGSGKTNTIKNWCRQLSRTKKPWMIIEPSAKREYRSFLSDEDEASRPLVFSLGTEGAGGGGGGGGYGAPFRLNPFHFEKGVELLTHLDALKACFNAAFPMYASMPYLLEEALVGVYRDYGWDLSRSENRRARDPWERNGPRLLFPTLQDLHEKIDQVVRGKRYDLRLEMDLSAALRARIGSLLLGSKGAMLNTRTSLNMKDLTEKNVVLEMGSMGSDDEKAFVMGLLILFLCEHAAVRGLSAELCHVLVVEEAHRLLRNTAPADNPEIANTRGAAVEQFANLLAEMRGFGQGVIIADQVPSKLLPDVLKNTGLKMIHQLCAADDRDAVGDTMALTPQQKEELARLEPEKGQAVVFHQRWEKAYCVKVDKISDDLACPPDSSTMSKNRERIIKDHKDVFGEKREYLGYSRMDAQEDDEVLSAVTSLLVGIVLDDRALRDKALGSFTRFDSLSGKTERTNWGAVRDAFDGFLQSVVRVSSAKLDLLDECPEMLLTLLNAASKDLDNIAGGLREKLMRILPKGMQAIEKENTLLREALRPYARVRELGRLPDEVGRVDRGDQAYRTLRERLGKHVELISQGADENVRRRLELCLVEHSVSLAGFAHASAVVAEYSRLFK